MALDFESLAKPRQVIVPLRNRSFVFEKKHYRVRAGDDGWSLVELTNNRAKLIESATLSGENYPSILGYTHQNTIIFQNMDVAKRKHSLGLAAPLYFNQAQTFEAIKAVVWEDGLVYWAEPNYADAKSFELKELLEQGHALTEKHKGITPELRAVFLFHALEREQMRSMLEEAAKVEEHDRMMTEIPYRLKVTFDRAGAEMTNYSISGNRIVVDWKVKGSHTEYNSVIDSRTWMILEAGYCMSGDDRRHNLTSLVKTAQEYEERRVVHITRQNYEEDWDN